MCKVCEALTHFDTPEESIACAILVGDYYGYPRCCSFAFIQGAMTGREPSRTQWDVSVGSFIPCPYHALEIANGRIKIEDLLKDRKCHLPFPRGGYSKTVLRAVHAQMKGLDCKKFIHEAHLTNGHSVTNQILALIQ